jgi:hypothetical protein
MKLYACVIAAAAALSFPAGFARAETRDATTVTLGWQTEHADLVLVAVVADETTAPGDPDAGGAAGANSGAGAGAAPADADHPDREIVLRVELGVKGDAAVGSTVRVRLPDHGLGSAWRPLVPHLVFLRAVRAPDGTVLHHVPVSGAFSVRAVEPGTAEARFPALVAGLRDVLESPDPAALRGLLVAWMEDADPGVAWSAATDFVRRTDLHAGLTDAERARIVAAYRAQPIGKTTKEALAYAAAATRTPDAVRALVDSLLLPDAHRIRGPVAEALRRIDSPETERLLASRLAELSPPTAPTGGTQDAPPGTAGGTPGGTGATGAAGTTGATGGTGAAGATAVPPVATASAPAVAQRCALLGALAVVGGTTAVSEVRALLTDAAPAVRVEAAAALGGMARNARLRDPEARLGVAATLSGRLTSLLAAAASPESPDPAASAATAAATAAALEPETRAVLWALAQLDEPGAFDVLRATAKSDATPAATRDYAARLLARPRQSLVGR